MEKCLTCRPFCFTDRVRGCDGKVLVHCVGGVSRSATIAVGYVMKHMHLPLDKAYRYAIASFVGFKRFQSAALIQGRTGSQQSVHWVVCVCKVQAIVMPSSVH